MRALVVLAALGICLSIGAAEEQPAPLASPDVVYAVTTVGGKAPVTAIYAVEVGTGLRRLLYRDTDEANRIILKMGGSDIVGVGRAAAAKDVYLVMGPTVAPEGAATAPADSISRLRFGDESGKPATPEKVLPLPLSFGSPTAYHMWNRAPILAVGPNGSVFALYAQRVGEALLERPAIRVIPTTGEEWRIALPTQNLYVADMAFSPDGRALAYSVLPSGDEQTLDRTQLPIAGIYLADIGARTTRLLYPGFVDALAWGPKPGQITAAARSGDIWSTKYLGLVLALKGGKIEREFSLRGAVSALAYSDDAQWLAVQSQEPQAQQIRVMAAGEGWPRPVPLEVKGGERISLLGWARLSPTAGQGTGGEQ